MALRGMGGRRDCQAYGTRGETTVNDVLFLTKHCKRADLTLCHCDSTGGAAQIRLSSNL
ncbi:hypothetical protein EMIT0P228_20579 [Pseudomonas brassicacearum]